MAINMSVQHNGGLLPDIILLTQGRVPRTVFFALAKSPIALKICFKNHDHQPFSRTLTNKNYRYL